MDQFVIVFLKKTIVFSYVISLVDSTMILRALLLAL